MRLFTLCLLSLGSLLAHAQDAERIGEVSTEFKLVGPNHKIIIEAFEDPKISGVTCYLYLPMRRMQNELVKSVPNLN